MAAMAKESLRYPGLGGGERHLVRISGDATRMVCADGHGNLRAWEIASPPSPDERASERADCRRMLLSATVPDIPFGIIAVGIDHAGRRAVSVGCEGAVQGWDLDRGTRLFEVKAKACPGFLVGVTADGAHAVFVGRGLRKGLRVLDMASGKQLVEIDAISEPVAVDADGLLAVAASRTGRGPRDGATFKLWDLRTCREVLDLGSAGQAEIVAFGPDRRTVVGGFGPAVTAWALPGGERIAELRAHTTRVTAVGFSPDGRRLFTRSNPPPTGYRDPSGGGFTGAPVSRSGFPLLVEWDLASGEKVQTPRKFVPIEGVVTADLSRAAAVDRLHQVVVWTPVETKGRELHVAARTDLSTGSGNFAWETARGS
jgi:WD40 repeat protein